MRLFVASVAVLLLLAVASTASASITPNPFGGRIAKPTSGGQLWQMHPFGGRRLFDRLK